MNDRIGCNLYTPALGQAGAVCEPYFAGHNFYLYTVSTGGQDSPVGVATPYRLDGLATESRWEAGHFHARPDRPRGPPSLLHNKMCTGSLPGSKAAGV